VRLLTLTGPGGVGKTRLALALAIEVANDFADGLGFIDLALVREPELVGSAIAQALGVRVPRDRATLRGVTTYLEHRDALLILDNVEHLLAASPLVARLLTACPRLVILTTSRSPLRLDGEHVLRVPPLSVPSAEAATMGAKHASPISSSPGGDEASMVAEVERAEAVRLFVARATAVRADFALTAANAPAVAEICRAVDGLPLAIELAAARCAVLSPEALLARLDRRLPLLSDGRRDAPPRMRSLHEAIAWSHDLLTRDEQRVFRRLAVFVGGFTLSAAEDVGGEGGEGGAGGRAASGGAGGRGSNFRAPSPPERSDSPSVLNLVTSLVNQSLLTRQEGPAGTVRFGMLETVREYALEKLAASDEEMAVHQRHAEHFIGLAEHVDRLVPRPDRWWEPFEAEWGNLRAALGWAVASGEAGLGLKLGGAMFGYWMLRGQIGEGIDWLERLLAVGEGEPAAVRGRGAMALGFLRWVAGDLDRAEALASEGLALGTAAEDAIGIAACWFLRGYLAEARGDLAAAAGSLMRARDRYDAAGQGTASVAAAAHMGRIAARQGDLATARELLTPAIAVLDSANGGIWGAANAYTSLGLIAATDGDLTEAASYVDRALQRHAAIGDQLATLISLATAARVIAATGSVEAARLAGAVFALRKQAGPAMWVIAQPVNEEAMALAREYLGEPVYTAAWESGMALDTELAITAARVALAAISGEPLDANKGLDTATSLTERELAVMRLVVAGQTDQEAAAALGLPLRTVNARVASARRKLGAPSRSAAAAAVVRRGLI
jgi:non-specific serine/threonine protein kinase